MSLRTELSQSEVKPFTKKSNLLGAWMVLVNWALLLSAMILVGFWPNPFSITVSLVVIANRQLGLAVLMHECAHYSLFESRFLNTWVGKLLCAAPVIVNLDGYRKYHMNHHKKAGTKLDPDYPVYKNFPVTRASFLRKVIRDLTGVTGMKTFYATMLMKAGLLTYDMSYQKNKVERSLSAADVGTNLVKNLSLPILFHLALFLAFNAAGFGWVYFLWWVSYFTVYMLIIRIRNASEHGAVENLLDSDPSKHARTTYANWIERLLFAPNYVNFHMEHHLRPSIPCYRLRSFHEHLIAKGHVDPSNVAQGYRQVISELVSA